MAALSALALTHVSLSLCLRDSLLGSLVHLAVTIPSLSLNPCSGSSVDPDLGDSDLPLLVRASDVRARLGLFFFASEKNQGSIE